MPRSGMEANKIIIADVILFLRAGRSMADSLDDIRFDYRTYNAFDADCIVVHHD